MLFFIVVEQGKRIHAAAANITLNGLHLESLPRPISARSFVAAGPAAFVENRLLLHLPSANSLKINSLLFCLTAVSCFPATRFQHQGRLGKIVKEDNDQNCADSRHDDRFSTKDGSVCSLVRLTCCGQHPAESTVCGRESNNREEKP